MAADVVNLTSAETVGGQTLTIDTSDGVMVDGAKVVTTDIECSNGVIHVIDTVMIPQEPAQAPAQEPAKPELKTIVETAVAAGSFETLVAAVTAADLVDTLSGPGPFTVFAPTDDAFAKLPAGTIDALLADPSEI
jgi:uncharacterized surface protein with fasciclin (FAS1) repeats